MKKLRIKTRSNLLLQKKLIMSKEMKRSFGESIHLGHFGKAYMHIRTSSSLSKKWADERKRSNCNFQCKWSALTFIAIFVGDPYHNWNLKEPLLSNVSKKNAVQVESSTPLREKMKIVWKKRGLKGYDPSK